jgi:DNA polymerase III epsilon subunit-like protein
MGNLTTAKAITFLDIETTHLNPKQSAVLSISIITDWDNGQTDIWTTKIKPRALELEYASSEALSVCKYNAADWSEAPLFEEVAETIMKKLKYGPLVAHNIQFDISHLKAAFLRRGWKELKPGEKYGSGNKKFNPGYPLIDTCALAYLFLPSERQNMNALREHFSIDKEGEHTPEKDAQDCRKIFYNIIGGLSK